MIRFTNIVALTSLAALASCGTPQQRCIASGTQDLQVLNRLIGESQLNLQRGYALTTETRSSSRPVFCFRDGGGERRGRDHDRDRRRHGYRGADWCFDDYTYTVKVPESINLEEEKQKLVQMQRKRDELAKAAVPLIAQCKATYPEAEG